MLKRTQKQVLDLKCFERPGVRLVDTMPRVDFSDTLGLESAVVQAARVSYGEGSKGPAADKKLIAYLIRNGHTSPFEMVEFKWHLEMPIFVARQWMRHRMASINEISARYTEVAEDKRFIHEVPRKQVVGGNKQCSEGEVTDGHVLTLWSNALDMQRDQYQNYKELCDAGVGREQARMFLPQNTMTQFYWKIDLHNLLKFLELRTHVHAQKETRTYANRILVMLKRLCPTTMFEWEEMQFKKNVRK